MTNSSKVSKTLPLRHSLRGKLLLAFIVVALLPLVVVGVVGLWRAQAALQNAATNKLIAVRDIKATQVENFFNARTTDVHVLAQNPSIVDGMRSLNLVIQSDANRTGITPAEQMAKYVSLYKDKSNLTNAKDGSAFSAVHSQLHLYMQKIVENYGYYDLFLINQTTGLVEYTVAKGDDFGADLKHGSYAGTNLGKVFQLAANNNDPNFTTIVDFAPYGPSQLPAAFVAAPITDKDGTKLGVIAFQLPVDEINNLMTERQGLGETGETYLIGADKTMRSESRFSKEDTMLKQKIDTPPVNAALMGETGVQSTIGYTGKKVLSAYKPLEIDGLDWAIFAETEQNEASAAINQLFRFMLVMFGVIVALVFGAAYFVALQLTNPLLILTAVAKRLTEGDAKLSGVDRNAAKKILMRKDEMGIMGSAFDGLVGYFSDMATAAQTIADGDLTVRIEPRSKNDVFGIAFNRMVGDLRDLVSQVSKMADYVNVSSQQLTEMAAVSGRTTQHVSDTIEQIAQGSVAQTAGIEKASTTVNQVVQAIEGVAYGAQEQANAANRTMELTHRLGASIQSVAQNAQQGAEGSAQAAQAAQIGASTIEESISGMATIKATVGQAVEKVHEMGKRSAQIGKIVETIDGIAAQTNLLALNAAIEAARTGAHSRELAETLLNHQLVVQAKLLAELMTTRTGTEYSRDYWRQLARSANIDNICITDNDGIIVYSDDSSLLGFRFPDDPQAQAHEFRKLIHMTDGVVTQPTRRRSIDNEVYKYVGVPRQDTPGIVQVGFHANSVTQFQLQVGGFAVVADEVRKLAEKSAGAAKEISTLIKAIQETVTEAVSAMADGENEVERGSTLADEAANALHNILQVVETVNGQVAGIAASADQMNSAADELSEGVETVSAVIEENTAATEEMTAGATEVLDELESIVSIAEENTAVIQDISETAEQMHRQVKDTVSSAQSLSKMADNLITLVSRFHLQAGSEFIQQVEAFRHAHEVWVTRVKTMLDGNLHLDETDITDHTTCTLGTWIYGRGQQDFADMDTFRTLEDPHAQLHQTVAACVTAYNDGNIADAAAFLPKIEALSQQIIESLSTLHQQILETNQQETLEDGNYENLE